MTTVKESCRAIYDLTYHTEKERLCQEALASSRTKHVSEGKANAIETEAQKKAINKATVETMRAFPNEESANIWKSSLRSTHPSQKRRG